MNSEGPYLVLGSTDNATNRNDLLRLKPLIRNETVRTQVCSYLSPEECARWTACCLSAIRCCQWQQKLLPVPVGGQGGGPSDCPPTWDGFTCWDATQPATTVYKDCPTFLQYSTPGGR